MSHFTRVQTRLSDLIILEKALVELNYRVEENGIVRDFGDNEESVDLLIRTGEPYDIGFKLVDGSIKVVGDFSALKWNPRQFLDRVTQRYAYLTVLDQAEEKGWQLSAEEVQPDGSIRLVMQRWV
ncbi:MAG: DUF1257 domain-containing protein [Anaerolineae bacterium]|nr:DUF1257 domain-containing protein [Anaerolineae bacterium]